MCTMSYPKKDQTVPASLRSRSDLVSHFFFTSKPYSYVCNAARGLIVCGALGLGRDVWSLVEASVCSLLLWLFFNWYSDYRQRDVGRIVPSIWLVIAPVAAALLICVPKGGGAVLFLVIYVLAIMVYPLKAVVPYVGPFGPVLRGGTIFAHFLFVFALLGPVSTISRDVVLIVFTLSLVHVARNLVGDIRDIREDKIEFPVRYGLRAALWALRLLFAISVVLSIFISKGIVTIGIPVLIQWIVIESLAAKCRAGNEHIVGYVGHRCFIITFTFCELLIAYALGVSGVLCGTLAFLALLLQVTYGLLPGKRFPKRIEILKAISAK